MFTGDASGTWLIRAMHHAGFANQPATIQRGDGLRLHGAYITAAVRCAPPDNRPRPQEIARCARFLERETALLTRVRVMVALGQIGFMVCRRLLRSLGAPVRGIRFAHGAVHVLGPDFPVVVASYHPSRQNTNTGRLTEVMLDGVFDTVRRLLEDPHRSGE
jgi:uracil-DNA glycosylase family 4